MSQPTVLYDTRIASTPVKTGIASVEKSAAGSTTIEAFSTITTAGVHVNFVADDHFLFRHDRGLVLDD
jgi:hypothetical protein